LGEEVTKEMVPVCSEAAIPCFSRHSVTLKEATQCVPQDSISIKESVSKEDERQKLHPCRILNPNPDFLEFPQWFRCR